ARRRHPLTTPPSRRRLRAGPAPRRRDRGSPGVPRASLRSWLQMATVAIPDLIAERRERVRAFMDEHVYPNEHALVREDEAADALIRELQHEAKEAGLWAPHLPPEAGGSGSGFIEYAYLNEEIGRSFIAQLI